MQGNAQSVQSTQSFGHLVDDYKLSMTVPSQQL
jgi:hypothetical protein